jgi:putative heme-binding domain-containing protein
MKLLFHLLLLGVVTAPVRGGPPEFLEDRFELPAGFRIYRAAGPELSGGSYALTFDGEGRLLVGDGNAVRRLIDKDGDGVFDSYDVIATGLGWRGPHGLLVFGDRLYAVGGDGIQLFEGYRSGGPLVHKGRLGNKLQTGGDHDAHTIFRGHDGFLYFMAGNGAGIGERRHITEESSPALFEREASVFRISPDGQKWECVGSGGRNPPNLGMNYLGELFSFDSDMEWHVGLPWYRPVRLNHWATGGDQGWQEVGAYPPYFIDCLPGILDVGRGSPTWGTFYEHIQLPERFNDAYIVCDYRWKRESNDQYATTGRLLAFFLKRSGASWKASMEVLAKPKPDARDGSGKSINFAPVDVTVAPDGSLFLSDHNQGIWRIFYDPEKRSTKSGPPTVTPAPPQIKNQMDRLLSLPQPGSEWSRLQEEAIHRSMGDPFEVSLREYALAPQNLLATRLRALRLLAADFPRLPSDFVRSLAQDSTPEMRGQAAWLLGIRGQSEAVSSLITLLNDDDSFVRRRAAEALARLASPAAAATLVQHLADPDRLVRSVSMTALAHRPTAEWFEVAVSDNSSKSGRALTPAPTRLRALVASLIRREPPADESSRRVITTLLEDKNLSREDHLDLLRVLALFQKTIEPDMILRRRVVDHLSSHFPDADRDIRWEQTRLLGEYRCAEGFSKLLALLESEREEVAQFHIAQAISKLPRGWSSAEEDRLLGWFLGTQRGWFTEFAGKGVEFPEFWATVLAEFGSHHRSALLRDLSRVDFASQLGGVAIALLSESPAATERLLALYGSSEKLEAKIKIVRGLNKIRNPTLSVFLREEYQKLTDIKFRGAILQGLAGQPADQANLPLIIEGVGHQDTEVARACVNALLPFRPELNESLAALLISRLADRRELFHSVQKVLVKLSQQEPAGFNPDVDPNRRPEEAMRVAALDFWKSWYERRFGALLSSSVTEKSDEEIHKFLMSDTAGKGDSARGAKVYEAVQCNTCHGGGVTPGREGQFFGPDLAGVTRRLSRQDLADAIVYPSKQVADRFKAYAVELKDATVLTGFITEQNGERVILADRDQVHRIPRAQVRSIAPQSNSLMPDRLLNRLGSEQIRDLIAFLEEGVRPAAGGAAGSK